MKLLEDVGQLIKNLSPGVQAGLSDFVTKARQVDYRPIGIKKVAVLTPEKDSIVIFKNFASAPGGAEELLEVLGECALAKAGPEGEKIWNRKLVYSAGLVGSQFNEKLASGRYSTFRALTESYLGAVERLEALHIANALIANGVSVKDAQNVDVLQWPATQGLASGKEPYSLVPLVSAYCDPDHWKYFPKAFSAMVLGTLTCGRSDVLAGLKQNINSVLEHK